MIAKFGIGTLADARVATGMRAQLDLRRRQIAAGADHVVGWTVLKPGARHENHRHHHCDEFFIVIKGHGTIYTDSGEKPSGEGNVVYSPRGCWHGFNNTSNEDVVLVWGWMGAGSIEASGYEVDPNSH